MYPRLRVLRQIICILFIFLVIITLNTQFIGYSKCLSCPEILNLSSRSTIFYNRSLPIEDNNTSIDAISLLCLEIRHHFNSEQYIPQSPIISVPSFTSSKLFRFPYRYSHWNSSSKLARLLTPCEHNLVMQLLIIIDRICRQQKITYFIIAGTLLGSLRHHDIIPWDDDVDLIMSYQEQKSFINAFNEINQTSIEMYFVLRETEESRYYKMFFKNTPQAGEFEWNFPFIDIFFYAENQTHLWNLAQPDVQHERKNIFPLILRPLGQLWMPTPRQPQRLFQFDPFDECTTHYWNHRNESAKDEITVKCNDLRDIYPFTERDNTNNSTEILKINNATIHTVIFK